MLVQILWCFLTFLTYTTASVGLAGVNIAGCDFFVNDTGYIDGPSIHCPNNVARSQMQHFSVDRNMYVFRLPVAWQFLVNNNLGGKLDENFMQQYDELVEICLDVGAYCIVDVHNYARWNGLVIGQQVDEGGPTNQDFISLWTQLAKRYRKHDKVVFGIMNEPHDLNIAKWTHTVRLVLKAIRNTGAKKQFILLPPSDWSAPYLLANNSGPHFAPIKDYDGSNNLLIFDLHQYYTSYGGEAAPCIANRIDDAFKPAANWLRQNNRQALITETGGRNNAQCVKYVCEALDFINANSDVYLGWVGWAAGSFLTTYQASEVPFKNGTDQLLLRDCIAGKLVSS